MARFYFRTMAASMAAALMSWLYAGPSSATILTGSASGPEAVEVYDHVCGCFQGSTVPGVVSFSIDTESHTLGPSVDLSASDFGVTSPFISFSIVGYAYPGGYTPKNYLVDQVEVMGNGELRFVTSLDAGNIAQIDISGLSIADIINPNLSIIPNITIDDAYLSGIHEGGYYLTWAPDTAVPEPAGWALMILGVGLTGGLLRRRARVGHQSRLPGQA